MINQKKIKVWPKGWGIRVSRKKAFSLKAKKEASFLRKQEEIPVRTP
jgi:hypothetical protein